MNWASSTLSTSTDCSNNGLANRPTSTGWSIKIKGQAQAKVPVLFPDKTTSVLLNINQKGIIMKNKPDFLNHKGTLNTIYSSGLRPWRVVVVSMLMLLSAGQAFSQPKPQMVRMAKIVVDLAQLEPYIVLLKEEIEASVRLEPGVLTLYAMSEKDNPTHITILEIYADSVAYKAHIQTPHFLKYKTGTKDMVKSLELVETVPLVPGMKIK
jgi:quinol monooxygenase YgiN